MSPDDPAKAPPELGPIVSSAHLAADGASELSEFEFGLTLANNAFHRWMVRCMAAAGYPDLGAVDILIVHTVNHRDRAKKLADICLVLNIEDTHVVTYALKKLAKMGLVESTKAGKENMFRATPAGVTACERYRQVRDQCLVRSFTAFGADDRQVGDLAGLLRLLSGLYDQAARAATSF